MLVFPRMFYFFRRGEQFVRCELRSVDERFEIAILGVDGKEAVERFDTEDAMTERWASLQREYVRQGWWGPHGRE